MALIDKLNAIGDAIREKKGTTEKIPLVDMPQAILDIVGGGEVTIGEDYISIIYNDDDTITLTDKDGIEHTMVCNYEDDKLVGVTYDGKTVGLTYDGGLLDYVGKTKVDLINAPISATGSGGGDGSGGGSAGDGSGSGSEGGSGSESGGVLEKTLDYTVTFIAEDEAYEIVHLTDGLSVYAPSVAPTKEGEVFVGWKNDDETITFPYTPKADTVFYAYFSTTREEMELYNAGDFIAEDADGTIYTKANDGWCIAGYIPDTYGYMVLVAKTEDACRVNNSDIDRSYHGSIDYYGSKYYFYFAKMNTTDGVLRTCNGVEFPPVGSTINVPAIAKSVLDKYFYIT